MNSYPERLQPILYPGYMGRVNEHVTDQQRARLLANAEAAGRAVWTVGRASVAAAWGMAEDYSKKKGGRLILLAG